MYSSCLRGAVLTALLSLLITGCVSNTTPNITIDFDSRYDFSGVSKIAILPIDRNVSTAVIISDIQIANINEAVNVELRRKGLEVVKNEAEADMLLTWHLVTQERTDIRSYDNASARYSSCWNCSPGSSRVTVRQYTQGTLIVDMIDPDRLQSVWRSIYQSRLRHQPDPERAEENRRAAAMAVFADFPPI